MGVFKALKGVFCIISIFLLASGSVYAQTLAFPGAEGFGRYAKGGRGGSVYHVANLNDTGAGSFRNAVSQPNRIIVFDVGGVIRIQSPIQVSPNLTIAGQTAPGDGICVYGNAVAFGGANNTIVRYIRFRMGVVGKNGDDAVGMASGKNVIFDHVSISWGRDGTLDMNRYGTETLDSITIQNCIISHGLQPHSTGGLMQTNGHISVLRSLYINNWTRNPKQTCNHQYVNNVVYNWGASCYNFGGGSFETYSNVTGNYFICGVGSTRDGIVGGDSTVFAYLENNYFDSNRNGRLDGTLFTNYLPEIQRQNVPYNYPAVDNESTATEAYYNIIQNAGASLNRDEVDHNLMDDLRSLGVNGLFITCEDELPTKGPGLIRGGNALPDSDRDGMPDVWEIINGLNPFVASDAMADGVGDGYANIERYINIEATKLTQSSWTFGGIGPLTYSRSSFRVNSAGGSGVGAVSFSIASGDACSLSDGNLLTVAAAGTLVLRGIKRGDVFYKAQMTDTTLIVSKAVLNVSVVDTFRTQGTPNPTFRLVYQGFVGEDNSSVLNVPPIAYSPASEGTPMGTYPVSVTGGVDDNYSFTYGNGVLSIYGITPVPEVPLLKLRVYPNPVKDLLTVHFGEIPLNPLVELFSSTGIKLKSVQPFDEVVLLNMQGYPAGAYVLKIRNNHHSTEQVVVKH